MSYLKKKCKNPQWYKHDFLNYIKVSAPQFALPMSYIQMKNVKVQFLIQNWGGYSVKYEKVDPLSLHGTINEPSNPYGQHTESLMLFTGPEKQSKPIYNFM